MQCACFYNAYGQNGAVILCTIIYYMCNMYLCCSYVYRVCVCDVCVTFTVSESMCV